MPRDRWRRTIRPMLRSRLTFANVISVVALVFALGGTSADAANTIFSADIVDGEVKTADLAASAVTNGKLAESSVGSGKIVDGTVTGADVHDGAVNSDKVADNTLTGQDIDESTLHLPGSAKILTNRLTVDNPSSGQTLLKLPDVGEIRVQTCGGGAATTFVNKGLGYADVAVDEPSVDPQFTPRVVRLAPNEQFDATVAGGERAIYQIGAGWPDNVVTVITTAWWNKSGCKFQAMAFIK
jgi:hypothetical protein